MAEHPIVMEGKPITFRITTQGNIEPEHKPKDPVVSSSPKVSDPKKSMAQRISKYAFGEEKEKPAEYIWESYLEPTGKRVANDIVEYFLQMLKHTFQRWIWHGKTLDDGKWNSRDRTSFSTSSVQPQPVKAMVKLSPVKELTFDTKSDADSVLAELKDTIKEEEMVTVRQYYEASSCPELCEPNGVSSTSGWTNLDGAKVCDAPDGDGFYIKLPRPISLKAKESKQN